MTTDSASPSPSEPSQTADAAAKPKRSKLRLLIKLAAVGLVLFVVTIIGLRLALVPIIRAKVIPRIEAQYGVDIELGDISVSLLSGYLDLSSFKMSEGDTVLVDTGRVTCAIGIRDLLGKNLTIAHCRIESPKIYVVMQDDGVTNLQRIFLPPADPNAPAEPPKSGPNPVVLLDDVVIADGEVTVVGSDASPLKGYTFNIHDLQVRVFDFQAAGPRVHDHPGDIRVHAQMKQPEAPAQLDVVAWSGPLDTDPTLEGYVVLTGLDLKPIPKLGVVNRAVLGGNILNLVVEVQAETGIIKNGQAVLEVAESGNTFPLKFAGPLMAPVVDKNSAMLSALKMSFARVGDVAINSSLSIISGGVSGVTGTVIGVGSTALKSVGSLGKGDVGGAVKAVGEGIGGGIGGLINKITGSDSGNGPQVAGTDPEQNTFWQGLLKLHHERTHAFLLKRAETAKQDHPGRAARFEQEAVAYAGSHGL